LRKPAVTLRNAADCNRTESTIVDAPFLFQQQSAGRKASEGRVALKCNPVAYV